MSNDELTEYLLSLSRECEWVAFKKDNENPQEIGEYLSALSNSACLAGRSVAYLVFGVEDEGLSVCEIAFRPSSR